MDEDQGQEVVIVDADGTEHHFPAGFDPAKAGQIVQRQTAGTLSKLGYMATDPLIPQIADAAEAIAKHVDAPALDRSQLEAQIRGFFAGSTEALGHITSDMTSPVSLALFAAGVGPESKVMEAVPQLKAVLKLKPVQMMKDAVSAAGAGSSVAAGAKGIVDQGEENTSDSWFKRLEGFAQMAGGAAGLGANEGVKAGARNTGRGMEYLGTRKNAVPFAVGMGMASTVPRAVMSGDLSAIGTSAAEGAMAAAVPPFLTHAGRKLQIMAGGKPASDEALEAAFSNDVRKGVDKNVTGAIRVSDKQTKVKLSDLDKNIAETKRDMSDARAQSANREENDRKLKEIREVTGNLTPGKPSASTSISAQTEDGGRISIRTPLKAKAEELSDLDRTIRDIRKVAPNASDDDVRGMAEKMLAGAKKSVPTVKNGGDASPPMTPAIRISGPIPGGAAPAAVRPPRPSIEVVDPKAEPQVKPGAQDVLDLEKQMNGPRGTSAAPAAPPANYMDQLAASLAANADKMHAQARPVAAKMEAEGQFGGERTVGPVVPEAMRAPIRVAEQPKPKAAAVKADNLSGFMSQVDAAMAGAASKSKSKSGWKNLSDNDAITAANAYASGVRNPDEIIAAILEKRKNRQSLHVDQHYADKQLVPEGGDE